MDELLKNCNTELFKVGDKVRIRQDIKDLAELRRADINRYTRIFPSEIKKSHKSFYEISYEMVASAGKTAEVIEIIPIIPNQSRAPLLSTLYRLKINGIYSEWYWKHALLEKVEEDDYGDSIEIIDDSAGLKTDFFAYDYKGRKRVFPDIDGFITKIDVTIISGDETGLIYFVKDGKANRVSFDASVGTRFISYDDGTYTVEGNDNIKKWLSWSYDKDNAKNVNYAIQHMIDFLGGDK